MSAADASASGSDAGFANKKKTKVNFINYNPPRKDIPEYLPPSMKFGLKLGRNLAKGLDNITGATKKNKEFMVNNYSRISKNYNLPDRAIFDKLDVKAQNKVYSKMRTSFQRNNLDPFGEKSIGGNNTPTLIKKNIGGQIVSVAPTAAEVSQSNAANATSEEDSIYSRKKKTKAKGRSATILTSSKGVDENLTLGKKSLLGA